MAGLLTVVGHWDLCATTAMNANVSQKLTLVPLPASQGHFFTDGVLGRFDLAALVQPPFSFGLLVSPCLSVWLYHGNEGQHMYLSRNLILPSIKVTYTF